MLLENLWNDRTRHILAQVIAGAVNGAVMAFGKADPAIWMLVAPVIQGGAALAIEEVNQLLGDKAPEAPTADGNGLTGSEIAGPNAANRT